jgi:hypothetical protein
MNVIDDKRLSAGIASNIPLNIKAKIVVGACNNQRYYIFQGGILIGKWANAKNRFHASQRFAN